MIIEKYNNRTFTPLNEVSDKLRDIFNSEDDIYLTVTAGGGKSHISREFAIEQVLLGKRVAFYVASNEFQKEFGADLRKAMTKKKQSLGKFFKNQSRLDFEIVSGREKSGCRYESTINQLKQVERSSNSSGLVTNWCSSSKMGDDGVKFKEDFPWSFEYESILEEITAEEAAELDATEVITDEQYKELIKNGTQRCPEHDICEWFNTEVNLGNIRIYTHAHLFSRKASNDNFKPDIVIVDEDIMGTAFRRIRYNKTTAKAVRDEFNRVDMQCNALAKVIELIAASDITAGWELKEFAVNRIELIYEAEQDWWNYLRNEKSAKMSKRELLYPELLRILAKLADQEKDIQSKGVYVNGDRSFNHVYFEWADKKHLPKDARLIVMDATGHIDVAQAIFRRSLVEHQINVKSPYADVTQVTDISASDTTMRDSKRYRDGRVRYLKSVQGDDVVIMAKKREGWAEKYYGNQRGSNIYEKYKEIHISSNYNLPLSQIVDYARCVYSRGDEIDIEQNLYMTKGRGITCNNYTFKDKRMRNIDYYLTDGELVQSLHRVRPIRRSKDDPVKIVIHTRRVLDVDVTRTVSWHELYNVSSKHDLLRRGAQMKWVNAVFCKVKTRALAGIVINQRNFVIHGFLKSRWQKNKARGGVAVTNRELVAAGFDVIRVQAKGSNGQVTGYDVALVPGRDYRDVDYGEKTAVSMEVVMQKSKFVDNTPAYKHPSEPLTDEQIAELDLPEPQFSFSRIRRGSVTCDPSEINWG